VTKRTGFHLLHAMAAGALVLMGAHRAAAVTLNDSVFQEYVYAQGIFHLIGAYENQPEVFATSGAVADESGWGTAATTGGALPGAEGSISLTAIGNPTRPMFGSFYGRVYYEWAVEQIGGDPYLGPIPIVVHASGAVDSSVGVGAKLDNLWAQAKFRTGTATEYHSAVGCVTGTCTLGPIAFDDLFVTQAEVDVVNIVELTALGSGNVLSDQGTFTISAWVDPRIEISPAFERRNDFRLAFGAGVVPIPEPSSVAMMLGGALAMAGALARRRR